MYGFQYMKDSFVVRIDEGSIHEMRRMAAWCQQYTSDGKFHYVIDRFEHGIPNKSIWKFEHEEDAMMFALKFV